jgi:hypothetical protein
MFYYLNISTAKSKIFQRFSQRFRGGLTNLSRVDRQRMDGIDGPPMTVDVLAARPDGQGRSGRISQHRPASAISDPAAVPVITLALTASLSVMTER